MRVAFVVDGFNLYHSVRAAERDLGMNLRWLDRTFLDAIAAGGAQVHLSKFQKKDRLVTLADARIQIRPARKWFRIPASWIRVKIRVHEEKRTDVAIGGMMLELLPGNRADALAIMTGDTDIIPAIETAKRLYPRIVLHGCFPYKRQNTEIQKAVDQHSTIRSGLYSSHQFPPTVVTPKGPILKPASW